VVGKAGGDAPGLGEFKVSFLKRKKEIKCSLFCQILTFLAKLLTSHDFHISDQKYV
jgi:hypothetical protein